LAARCRTAPATLQGRVCVAFASLMHSRKARAHSTRVPVTTHEMGFRCRLHVLIFYAEFCNFELLQLLQRQTQLDGLPDSHGLHRFTLEGRPRCKRHGAASSRNGLTGIGPTGMGPTGITGIGPAGICPAGIGPTGITGIGRTGSCSSADAPPDCTHLRQADPDDPHIQVRPKSSESTCQH
jgi:hypothetical protein